MADPIQFAGRAHLEARIRQQRHTITVLQAKLRERNVRTRMWFEGREALLVEQASRRANEVHSLRARVVQLESESVRREPPDFPVPGDDLGY